MAAFTQAYFGVKHPLVGALFLAETLEPEDLAAAALELERLPARDRRKLEASYGAHLAERAQLSAQRSAQQSAKEG